MGLRLDNTKKVRRNWVFVGIGLLVTGMIAVICANSFQNNYQLTRTYPTGLESVVITGTLIAGIASTLIGMCAIAMFMLLEQKAERGVEEIVFFHKSKIR
jgi:hypothetical protein